MTGDGLTDLVLVHDGSVVYWPNLGHGRFGTALRMRDAPSFNDSNSNAGTGYDPRRLLLGSVTGLGPADLVYVGDGHVDVWLNQAGNAFAPAERVHGTPRTANRATVRLVDILGIGVVGVLWSGLGHDDESAFLDLTGGVKPYLLTDLDNHRGATTRLTWSTSTAYAGADRDAGRPWSTTLPFPVHVLAGVTTNDLFADTVQTTGFIYHDGYWDAADREFRGFGRVEQVDTLAPRQQDRPAPPQLFPLDPLTPNTALPIGFDAAAHGNLLANWSFDEPRPGGPTTLVTTTDHPAGPGDAAAAGWTTWNNVAAVTATNLQQSDLPAGSGGAMLHVITDGAGCGIVQTFLPEHTGPPHVVSSVWVKVVRGSVLVGTGDGGSIAVDATIDAEVNGTARWTLVQAGNQRTPANEFIVYSGSSGGAEFYVDHAWVRAVDVPTMPFSSPPVRRLTWFHLGPVGPASGAWKVAGGAPGCWAGDAPLVDFVDVSSLPTTLPRPALRRALRGLRGRVLRSEVYAEDADPVRGDRPFEISDARCEVVPVLDGRDPHDPAWLADPVFTVRDVLNRSAVWDRGDDPMTHMTVSGNFDPYGRPGASIDVSLSRGRDPRSAGSSSLATVTRTSYATRDDTTGYRIDRVASVTRHEAVDPGDGAVLDFAAEALHGKHDGELRALAVHHFDGPAFTGLEPGRLGEHGLPTRTEALVLTPAALEAIAGPVVPGGARAEIAPYLRTDGGAAGAPTWTADYPDEFRTTIDHAPVARGPHIGYLWHDADGSYVAGYYQQSTRVCYDVQQPVPGRTPRGLPVQSRDAFAGTTFTTWDIHDLVPVSVTDPSGMTTRAAYDYRLLKVNHVVDVNGNRTTIRYTPLGLPANISHLGQPGKHEGDTLTQPSKLFRYSLTAYDDATASGNEPAPVSITTVQRVEHRWAIVDRINRQRAKAGSQPLSDVEATTLFGQTEEKDHPERFVRTVEYSDGFSRLLQTRTQADQLDIDDIGLSADTSRAADTVVVTHRPGPAVVVSGWKRYDNKGRVVVTYEPFRSIGFYYERATAQASSRLATITQHFDSQGRPTIAVAPDGSRTTTVYGIPDDLKDPERARPTPWEIYTYDPDDNAGRTHPAQALDYAHLWNTPSSVTLDAHRRPIRHVHHGLANEIVVVNTYDIDGNLTSVTDPAGRVAAAHRHDLTGRTWAGWLIDAGTTRHVHDAAGGTIEVRDDKGALTLSAYDRAHRNILNWAADGPSQDATLRNIIVHGDDPDSGLTKNRARTINALGRVLTTYDEAGRASVGGYDLDGNQLSTTRHVLRPEVLSQALPAPGPGQWTDTAYRIDWQPQGGATLTQHAGELLDNTTYRTDETYDALGRKTTTTAPTDATGNRATAHYRYAHGGGIAAVDVDGTTHVQQVVYDAHGRRTAVLLGNGVLVRYLFDPRTFRLRRLHTQHARTTDDAWTIHGPILTDQTYRHDLGGNLLNVADRTPGCGLPAGADPQHSPGPDTLNRTFEYDALERLVSATGRESDTQHARPWDANPRNTDPTRTRPYTETYTYDDVGNLRTLQHTTNRNATGAYTRTYTIGNEGNQLTTLTSGATPVAYTYDPSGNLTTQASNRHFEWNHADQLATFRDQAGGQQPSVYAQYRYTSGGERLLKLVRRSSGPDEVTIYLGSFERVLRGRIGSPMSVHDEIHVLDGLSRIVTLQRGTPHPKDPMPDQPVRYHLADHLSSVTATIGADAAILNREEFLPYGETSFGGYARKRYRFTGRHRDDESGLTHHGARYYAPWLCRWASPDPLGVVDGTALYSYARNNPLNWLDAHGGQATAAPQIGASGIYRLLPTVAGYTREHVIPGAWMRYVMEQAYGKGAAQSVSGRAYQNSQTTLLSNDWAGPKTGLDNSYAAGLRAQTAPIEPTAFYLQAMQNARANGPLTPAAEAALHESALKQVATYIKSERYAADAAAGKAVPRVLSRLIRARTGPGPVNAPKPVQVTTFPAGGATIQNPVLGPTPTPSTSGLSRVLSASKTAGTTAMKGLGAGLAVVGALSSGWQFGTGLNQLATGAHGEGAINVVQGGFGLGSGIGVPMAVKAAGEGASALIGGSSLALSGVTLLAGASVGLAAETARASLRGQETPIDVADKFYGTHFADIAGWVSGRYR